MKKQDSAKNSGRKNKERNRTYELLYQSAFVLFFYGIGTLLTFYVHDAYYDIMQAKASCFLLIMRILLPFVFLTIVYKYVILKRKFLCDALDLAFPGLLVSFLLSTLLSTEKGFAFRGDGGWFVGTRTILYLSAVFLALKDEKYDMTKVLRPLSFVFLFEFVLTILDGAGLDLFGFRELIATNNYYIFYATIGNANWYVGYLSLAVPLFLCLYLKKEERFWSTVYLLVSLSGILSCIINGADGIYLALGLCAFFAIPFVLENRKSAKRFSLLLIMLGLGLLVIRLLPAFERRRMVMNGFGRYFFVWWTIALILSVGLLSLFVLSRIKDESFEKRRKGIVLFLEILLASAVCLILFAVLNGKTVSFDNGRMEIWQTSIDAYFRDYSFIEKLFGIGPELLQLVYYPLSEKYGILYNSAHSEPLHLLLGNGLLGVLSWFAVWIAVFVSYFRSKDSADDLQKGLFFSLISYFAQSLVNSATVLNLCLLCAFFILLKGKNAFDHKRH